MTYLFTLNWNYSNSTVAATARTVLQALLDSYPTVSGSVGGSGATVTFQATCPDDALPAFRVEYGTTWRTAGALAQANTNVSTIVKVS
jgi:hypothetical protein